MSSLYLEILVDPEQCGPNEIYHHANKTNHCLIGCKSGNNIIIADFPSKPNNWLIWI